MAKVATARKTTAKKRAYKKRTTRNAVTRAAAGMVKIAVPANLAYQIGFAMGRATV